MPIRNTAPGRLAMSSLLAALVLFAVAGCSQPSSAEQRAQAATLRQHGDYRAAVVALKSALAAEPNDAGTRYQLAQAYLDMGDSLPAEKEARQALQLGYARGPALALLAAALVLQGQQQKALDDTAGGPDLPALVTARADAMLALGRSDEARAAYEHVLATAPGYAAAGIGLGRLAWIDGQADAARAGAERVLAAEPRNTDALMFEADLLRADGHADQAIAVYDQVLALSPQHRTAHIEKAYTAVGLRRFDLAQAELNAEQKIAPGSLLAWYTQALLDYSRGKPEAARDTLYKILKAAPDHMPSVLLAGAVNLKLRAYYQAEHYFSRYLERNPDNLQARKMLASALLGSGHADDALAALQPALKKKDDDAQLLALAGESNLRRRRFDAAADLFEQASTIDTNSASLRTALGLSQLGKGDTSDAVTELQTATKLDKTSIEAGEALVRAQMTLGHKDAALDAADALLRAHPDKAPVLALKAQVQAGRGEADAARAGFQHALAADPAYYPAAAGLTQLALDARHPDAARQVLLDFVAKNKTSVEAMAALATLADRAHDAAAVTRWLEQAAAVDPHAIGPGVNLIAEYLRSGHPDKALDLAHRLRVSHPDDADLLDLLAKAQMAGGDMAGALDSYKSLAAALPRSAAVRMQIAALRIMMGNLAQGEEDLKVVLAMQPDFPSAQVALADLYVRKGSPDLALLVASHLQRAHPEGSAGFQLEGDVQMAKHQPEPALAAYEKAFALGAKTELVVKIDNALREARRVPEAERRLAAWLDKHPDDIRALTYRAQTWMAAGDYKRGAAQLEDVVRRQPANVVALNNLALAYQELGDARAQATAEAAVRHAGERPDVLDTLAWILVGKGDAGRALTLLQKAHAAAPAARDIRYHLAAALAASGDKDGARKELGSLLAGDMRFAQADDARKLMARLNAGG